MQNTEGDNKIQQGKGRETGREGKQPEEIFETKLVTTLVRRAAAEHDVTQHP